MAQTPNLFNLNPLAYRLDQSGRQFNYVRGSGGAKSAENKQVIQDPYAERLRGIQTLMDQLAAYDKQYQEANLGIQQKIAGVESQLETAQRDQFGNRLLNAVPVVGLTRLGSYLGSEVLGEGSAVQRYISKINGEAGEFVANVGGAFEDLSTFISKGGNELGKLTDNLIGGVSDILGSLFGMGGHQSPEQWHTSRAAEYYLKGTGKTGAQAWQQYSSLNYGQAPMVMGPSYPMTIPMTTWSYDPVSGTMYPVDSSYTVMIPGAPVPDVNWVADPTKERFNYKTDAAIHKIFTDYDIQAENLRLKAMQEAVLQQQTDWQNTVNQHEQTVTSTLNQANTEIAPLRNSAIAAESGSAAAIDAAKRSNQERKAEYLASLGRTPGSSSPDTGYDIPTEPISRGVQLANTSLYNDDLHQQMIARSK
jgi:hypothetical protein